MVEKRKSYSIEFKISTVEESYNKPLTIFCKEKKLDLRMVRRWREKYVSYKNAESCGNSKKHKIGTGRQPTSSELEDEVFEWICERRAKSLIVSRTEIQKYALNIAVQFEISLDKFKASSRWLDGFIKRYDLSLRKSTSLFKLPDDEIANRALSYKTFVDNVNISNYKPSNVVAMDETSIYLGHGMQTTIDYKGATSIYIPSTGYESFRITCILAIRLDGQKVAPIIITKGKKDTIRNISGVYVLETEKAWCTQSVIQKWIDLTFPLVLRGGDKGLLIWDSASTHRAKEMKDYLHGRKVDQIMIPAGMTPYLQTLDIGINKPFKDYLKIELNDFIENRMIRNTRGNFVKPSIEEVVNWVKKSWIKITDDCIKSTLKAGYLDISMPFTKTLIARHERIGHLICQKIKDAEYKVNQHVYEDVPEDDELIVIE